MIKKVNIMVSMVVTVVFLSSCMNYESAQLPTTNNNEPISSSLSSTTSNHSNSDLSKSSIVGKNRTNFVEELLTESEALEIAKKVINPSKPELIIDIDRIIAENDESYFIIHEYYTTMIDDEVGQSFTLGWYRLNRKTEKLYKSTVESKKEVWILMN